MIEKISICWKIRRIMSKRLTLCKKSKLLVLHHQSTSVFIPKMYGFRRVSATHYGIWNFITNLSSDNTVILTVFMHDPVAGNCSHSTDFYGSSQDSVSGQIIFFISGTLPVSPHQHTISCSTTLRTVGLRLKLRYTKHVHGNIDILDSEFFSTFIGTVKKYCKVLWHFSVATLGVYWRLLWSTTVRHI